MSQHDYLVKYGIEVGRFKKDSLDLSKEGAADALLMTSILFPKDGSYSQITFSIDGRNDGKPLTDIDKFKAWVLMAKDLSESEELCSVRKAISGEAWETFKNVMKAMRELDG